MSDPESSRLYVAVPCPVGLANRLLELQSHLEADTWSLRLSDPRDFHLTLHFLGQTPNRVIDDLHRELGAVAHALRPFDLEVTGLGAFENWDDPCVIWAGVHDPAGKLAELFQATRRVLDSYRLFKLAERHAPHITLGRVKKISAAWDPRRLQALMEWKETLGVYPVEKICLMRSQVAPLHDETLGSFRLLT